MEFDASGSSHTREIRVPTLAPHPNPLPQGEGTAVEPIANNQARLVLRRAANDSPSPQGRGLGMEPIAQRPVFVWSLAALWCQPASVPVGDLQTGIGESHVVKKAVLMGSNGCGHSVRRVAGRNRRVACATRNDFSNTLLESANGWITKSGR